MLQNKRDRGILGKTSDLSADISGGALIEELWIGRLLPATVEPGAAEHQT